MTNDQQQFNAELFHNHWLLLADRLSYKVVSNPCLLEMPYPLPGPNFGLHLSVPVIKAIEKILLPYPTSEKDVVLPAGSCLGLPIDIVAKTDDPNQQPETHWLLTFSGSTRYIPNNHPIWQFFDEIMICRYPNFKRRPLPRGGQGFFDLQQTFLDNYTASTTFPQYRYTVCGKPGIPKEKRDYWLAKKYEMCDVHQDVLKSAVKNYLDNGGCLPNRYTLPDGSVRCDLFMASTEFEFHQFDMFGDRLSAALKPIRLESVNMPLTIPSPTTEKLFWTSTYAFNLFIQAVPPVRHVEHLYNSIAVGPIQLGMQFVSGFERVCEFSMPINHDGKQTRLTVTVKKTAMWDDDSRALLDRVDIVAYPKDVNYDNSFITWYAGLEDPLLQPLIRNGVTLPVVDGRFDSSSEEVRLYEGAVTRKRYSVTATQRLMGKDQEYKLKFLPLKDLLK